MGIVPGIAGEGNMAKMLEVRGPVTGTRLEAFSKARGYVLKNWLD